MKRSPEPLTLVWQLRPSEPATWTWTAPFCEIDQPGRNAGGGEHDGAEDHKEGMSEILVRTFATASPVAVMEKDTGSAVLMPDWGREYCRDAATLR